MKRNKILRNLGVVFLTLCAGLIIGFCLRHFPFIWKPTSQSVQKILHSGDDHWPKETIVFQTVSQLDREVQNNHFIKSTADGPSPLVVSLHYWNGDYKTYDPIAKLALNHGFNYLSPNFRGPNDHPKACCSEYVIADIDEAIEFVINHHNVDVENIYLVGVSGGGYASLCYYLKGNKKIKKVSAWAAISDLEVWYNESKVRGQSFVQNIENCTSCIENNTVNYGKMRERSPMYWSTQEDKLQNSKLYLYAGVYDGITGSVPFTHSINFYNKIIKEMGAVNDSCFVTNEERLSLLDSPIKEKEANSIQDRGIFLKKSFGNASITIFEGGHEILHEYAFNELINQD